MSAMFWDLWTDKKTSVIILMFSDLPSNKSKYETKLNKGSSANSRKQPLKYRIFVLKQENTHLNYETRMYLLQLRQWWGNEGLNIQ